MNSTWKLAFAALAVLFESEISSAQQIPSTTTAAELWNPWTWFWPYAIASAEGYRDYYQKAQKATNELYQQIYATNAFPWITGNWGGSPNPGGQNGTQNQGGQGGQNQGGQGGQNQDQGGQNQDQGGQNQDQGGQNQDQGGQNQDQGGQNQDQGGQNQDQGGQNQEQGGQDQGGESDQAKGPSAQVESNVDGNDANAEVNA